MNSPELSLTVPIVNTLAFLFTVLGDWWVEKKVINRGKNNVHSDLGVRILTIHRHMDWDGIVIMWHCVMCTQQIELVS